MTHDRFAHLDAAYVLGALAPDERLEFEQHLRTCADCAQAVQEVAALPGLLAKVPLDEVPGPTEPVPGTLLPALSGAVRRERTRTRRTALVLAAASAAVVGAVGWGVTVAQQPAAAPVGVAMTQVAATPVRVDARLEPAAWGTRITLTCWYHYAAGGTAYPRYALVVVDRTGHAEQVATWQAVPGRSSVDASTAWSKADIARLEVRTSTGVPVLRLST